MDPSAPGWYPDPTGRHELRYWSGIRWSRHVNDLGQRSDDPFEPDSRTTAVVSTPARRTTIVPMAVPAPLSQEMQRPAREPAQQPQQPRQPRQPRHSVAPGPLPPNRRRYMVIAGALVVLLVAAGAVVMLKSDEDDGGGDKTTTTSDGDQLIAAMTKSLDRRGLGTLTDAQYQCMSDALVKVGGREHLIEQGVDKGADPLVALDPGTKEQAITKAFDCVDDPTMLAFMAADWSQTATGKAIGSEKGPCVFQGLFEGLGRDRIIFMFSAYARFDQPGLQEVLNENEMPLVSNVMNSCLASDDSSTTTAP